MTRPRDSATTSKKAKDTRTTKSPTKKRARTETEREPSPPPTTSSTQELWRSALHEQRFHEKISARPVIRERKFVLDKDEYPEFQSVLIKRGWEKYGMILNDNRKAICQEFFANAYNPEGSNRRRYVSFVRGKEVKYDAHTIQKILKTNYTSEDCYYVRNWQRIEIPPRKNTPEFASYTKLGACEPVLKTVAKPDEEWVMTKNNENPRLLKLSQLNGPARVWYHFIVSNVMPCSNQSEVILMRAVLINTILKGEPINLPKLLQNSIYEMAHNDSKIAALGHSSLITHLCMRAGVDIPTEGNLVKLHPPINAKEIRKQFLIANGQTSGMTPGRKKKVEEADDIPPSLAKRSTEQWLINTERRLGFLRRRMKFMQTFQSKMYKMMASLCRAQGLEVEDEMELYPHSKEENDFERAEEAYFTQHVDEDAQMGVGTSKAGKEIVEEDEEDDDDDDDADFDNVDFGADDDEEDQSPGLAVDPVAGFPLVDDDDEDEDTD